MPPSNNVERLLSLALTLASSERGLTRDELMRVVPGYSVMAEGSRRRQFVRDIQRLEKIGYAVHTFPDPVDVALSRYRIVPDRARGLSLGSLDSSIRAVLGASAAMFSSQASSGIGLRVRAKLAAEGITVGESGYSGRLGQGAAFTAFIEASADNRRLTFVYSTRAGHVETRTFEPWRVGTVDGREYVYGFDVDRDAPRLFRIDRCVATPKDAGPAKNEHGTMPELRTLVSHATSEPVRENVTVSIEPFKALGLRELLGMSPEQTTVEVDSAAVPNLVKRALAEPLWVRLDGESEQAAQWRSARERIALAHESEARNGEAGAAPAKLKKARAVSSFDDDLSRVTALIAYVHRHPQIAIEDLAAHFGTSESAIEADLATIYMAADYSSGFEELVDAQWSDGYVSISGAEPLSAPLVLAPAEVSALVLGIEALRGKGIFSDTSLDAALQVLDVTGLDRVENIGAAPDHSAGEREEVLTSLLLDAAREERIVRITYSPPDRKGLSVRDVRIEELTSAFGHLYVSGHCFLAGESREFRLDRIVAAVDPNDSSAPQTGNFTSSRVVTGPSRGGVEVEADPSALWVLEAFRDTAPLLDVGGGIRRATIRPASIHALVAAIFETGGAARVLSPQTLRDDIARIARRSPVAD